MPDHIDLSIPMEFDIQGEKLIALTQATAYRGIMERKPKREREAAKVNLQRTREAVGEYCGAHETNETIWQSLRNRIL
jgi:hypothetical protein